MSILPSRDRYLFLPNKHDRYLDARICGRREASPKGYRFAYTLVQALYLAPALKDIVPLWYNRDPLGIPLCITATRGRIAILDLFQLLQLD